MTAHDDLHLNVAISRVARLDTREGSEVEVDDEGRQVYSALAYTYDRVDTFNTTLARGSMAHVVPEDFRILEYHKSDRDPVGKPVSVEETVDGPVVRFVFADTERAQELRALVDGGFLRAVSVGFIPTDGYVREDGVMVYTRADLHELSLVNTPSSKGALISLARDLHADEGDVASILGLDLSQMDDETTEGRAAVECEDVTPDAVTVEPATELSDDDRRTAALAVLRDLGVDESVLAQLLATDNAEEAATVDTTRARKALALIRRTRS